MCSFDEIDRMPTEFADAVTKGEVPVLKINAFDVSAAAKIKTALAVISGKNGLVS